MRLADLFHGLQFDDHLIGYKQIGAKRFCKCDAFVDN
jgi:hypothetical protein